MQNEILQLQHHIIASYLITLQMKQDIHCDPHVFYDDGCKVLVDDINQKGHDTVRLILDHGNTPAKSAILSVVGIDLSEVMPWSYAKQVYLPRLERFIRNKEIKTGAIEALQHLKESQTEKALLSMQKTLEDNEGQSTDPTVGNARAAAVEYMERLEKLLKGEKPESKIETGVPMFNRRINSSIGGGLHTGQIGAIGARPGRGKSSFAFWLVDMALKNDEELKACIFSLEMPAADVAKKLLETQMHREIQKYHHLNFSHTPSASVASAALAHADDRLKRLVIDDECPQSAEQLIARAHQLSKKGVKLFVVDYIQLVNVGDVPAEMLRVAYGRAVRLLTEDAKNNDRCWIILTQLSRSADGRAPVLSDAKETSAIEENMHWILGLHRDTMNDGKLHPTELQCWVLKNRYGPAGELVRFDASWKTNFFTERL
jgi:replicative DNA helicase